jgi:Protein of unknown function (DUF3142)
MFFAKASLSPPTRLRRFAGWAVVTAVVSLFCFSAPDVDSSPVPARTLEAAPPVILWTWERPDDLRFVDPARVGISFLAGTLTLAGDDAVFRPRLNSLRFPSKAFLMACIRVESDRASKPTLSPAQRSKAVEMIAGVSRLSGVKALQLDFDAVPSARPFYTALLKNLRAKLPTTTSLSITALASWCLNDDWVSDLPVDEAVPMLFRMGPDRSSIVNYLRDGGDFRPAVCRKSLGLSTDEPLSNFPKGRRIYLFHTGAWTEEAVRQAVTRVKGVG